MQRKIIHLSKKIALLAGFFVLPFSSCTNEETPSVVKSPFQLNDEKLRFITFTKDIIRSEIDYGLPKSKDEKGRQEEIVGPEGIVSDFGPTNDLSYNSFNPGSWVDPQIDRELGVSEEHDFTVSDLSAPVRNHITAFETKVDQITRSFENGLITEEQGIAEITNACRQEGNASYNDPALTSEERTAVAESFHMFDQLSVPLSQYVEEYAIANGISQARFLRRLLRAVARVAIAAVVTAIVVAIPVSAVVVAKAMISGVGLASVKIAGVKGAGAIIKACAIKGKIGAIKGYAPALAGMGVGIKNAYKYWDSPWKGWEEVNSFGIKIKV